MTSHPSGMTVDRRLVQIAAAVLRLPARYGPPSKARAATIDYIINLLEELK